MSWENKNNYNRRWGNYKSDKHKSKGILKEQIRTILTLGEFSKEELIKIKDTLEHLANY